MKKILALALLLSATAFADTGGVFNNPSPTCPPATCSGLGTSSFSWGDPPTPGNLTFTGNGGSIAPGSPYQLGSLSYFNGSIPAGTEVNQITLSITTNFNDATNSVLNLVINIVNTPNAGGDPSVDADYIFFQDYPDFGTFRVYELDSATIKLFANADGSFGGIGDPDGGGFVTPEPASLLLFGTGLAGAMGGLRRKFLTR